MAPPGSGFKEIREEGEGSVCLLHETSSSGDPYLQISHPKSENRSLVQTKQRTSKMMMTVTQSINLISASLT